MNTHYQMIVAATDKSYENIKTRLVVDEQNHYLGASDDMYYITEPGSGTGIVNLCATLYVCEESKYYRAPELLTHIKNACDMLLRVLHDDGTSDLLITNFYTPATFEIVSFCRGYNSFVKYARMTPEEESVRALMIKALEKLSSGCLNGGFHTPNHRWVECAAMLMSYNILGWQALLEKTRSYLSEGIDCDEYGEFTERSMGCYNPINVNSMIVMAQEGNLPELYEYAQKNLDLTFDYLDGDGTLFTKNSRRQDKGEADFYPAHRWYYLYLWAGVLFNNPKYIKFAAQMFENSVSIGEGVPGVLWLYQHMPELKTLDLCAYDAEIADTYHAYYPKSNILRVRKRDFSYTFIANNPDFMYIKFGKSTLSARMCASFFAVAQFAPKKVEKTETGYRMVFSAHGEYKGLFPTPPKSPDWDAMDHSLRPVLHSCELDFTLDITDLEDGVKLNITVDNTPRVPFKLEFALPAGTRVETDQMIMDVMAGGTMALKGGNVRLEDIRTGSELTISGLFAEHMYHKQMRGSIPPADGAFSLYATGFSPINSEITIKFSKRAHARAMREKV